MTTPDPVEQPGSSLHATPPSGAQSAPQPVREADRLGALDVARGLALLGIFMVNVESFGEPFGKFVAFQPEARDPITLVCYYAMNILCEGKFYPLFSMLFGMGLILQMRSVESRGGKFSSVYLRRLAILLAFGFLHATLMWYGDILFFYAICGLILFLCRRLSATAMLVTSGVIVAIATVTLSGFFTLAFIGESVQSEAASKQTESAAEVSATPSEPSVGDSTTSAAGPDTETAPAPVPDSDAAKDPVPAPNFGDDSDIDRPERGKEEGVQTGGDGSDAPAAPDDLDRWAETSSFGALMDAYRDRRISKGPEEPLHQDLETRAYRDGPFIDALLFRVMSWLFFLFFGFLGMSWHVLAMFFLGAGLLKAGLFDPERRALRTRLIVLGAVVGLPGSAAAVVIPEYTGWPLLGGLFGGLVFVFGPMVSLAILCLASRAVEDRWLPRVSQVLASNGRMALTLYLSQTLIATGVFYWWGLAQFGSWTRGERVLLVLGVYAAQCVVSSLWLSRFRFGPMEWLWRTLTYGKVQPMGK